MSVSGFYLGDCLEVLKTLPDSSIDAVVTDPPYHLTNKGGGPSGKGASSPHARSRAGAKRTGFMGMAWDGGDIAHRVELWAECLRVLKPGGHLLAFAGTRTYHRMTCAIEDAGFEIRDMVAWVYGSGFPKSKNLDGDWAGWGTALKPSQEPIAFARKPLAGTVAENVLAFGTGALNIDGCRVALSSDADAAEFENNHRVTERLPGHYDGQPLGLHDGGWKQRVGEAVIPCGRWPANLIHDGSDEVVALFPNSAGQQARARTDGENQGNNTYGALRNITKSPEPREDSGSAARFFYCAKATRADRHDGLEEPGPQFEHGSTLRDAENLGAGRGGNHHPTVKPTDLMRYLCRLVTPPGGVVLDPFMGSGSTGRGAVLEGFRFVGIERETEYFEIARARIAAAQRQYDDEHRQMGLELCA